MQNAPFARKITNADRRAVMIKAWRLSRKYFGWTMRSGLLAAWSDLRKKLEREAAQDRAKASGKLTIMHFGPSASGTKYRRQSGHPLERLQQGYDGRLVAHLGR
jgi:hypothetical protein